MYTSANIHFMHIWMKHTCTAVQCMYTIFKNAFYWLSVKIIISMVSILILSVCVAKPLPILQDGVFNMCILLIIWLYIMCVYCMFINYCCKNNCANCTFLSTSVYNSLKESVKKGKVPSRSNTYCKLFYWMCVTVYPGYVLCNYYNCNKQMQIHAWMYY